MQVNNLQPISEGDCNKDNDCLAFCKDYNKSHNADNGVSTGDNERKIKQQATSSWPLQLAAATAELICIDGKGNGHCQASTTLRMAARTMPALRLATANWRITERIVATMNRSSGGEQIDDILDKKTEQSHGRMVLSPKVRICHDKRKHLERLYVILDC